MKWFIQVHRPRQWQNRNQSSRPLAPKPRVTQPTRTRGKACRGNLGRMDQSSLGHSNSSSQHCSSINKKPRSVTPNEQIILLWCVCSLHPHNFLCSSPLQASSHSGPSDACCFRAAFEIIALKPGGAPQKKKKMAF